MNKYETLKQLLKEYQQAVNEYLAVSDANAYAQCEELRDATSEELEQETKLYNKEQAINKQIEELTGINGLLVWRLAVNNKINELLAGF